MSHISTDDEIWGTGTFGSDPRRRCWPCGSEPQKPLGLKLEDAKFDEIKAKCLKEGRLFEDPDFRADDSTLCDPTAPPKKWRRPKEIQEILRSSKTPEFFVDGASRFDIEQFQLGDCWMLAALSCISMHPHLMNKVVPDGQNFKAGEYAGIFRFNFWSFGKWIEVIIDDRLPTNDRGLVYTSSAQENEYWTALLEKAFAKLYGSYQAIQGGHMIEAMEDFTGGIGEIFKLGPKASPNLWSIMMKAHGMGSLMCCSTDPDPDGRIVLPNGLVPGHAYSVTGVLVINFQQFCNLQMVRVRNPFGNSVEWNGAWSDNSPSWSQISESERKKIGLVFEWDGEFWMSFDEFVNNFQWMDICHLNPKSFIDDSDALKKKRWAMTCLDGCWKKGTNAGGHVDGPTAWINPQYGFEVVDVDEDDNKDAGTVIIALMQKDRRKKRLPNLNIGYAIYKLNNPASAPMDMNFDFKDDPNKLLKVSEAREVCGRHELIPGSYCVVPFTELANQEADFILRFSAEKPLNSKELDEPTGIKDLRREVKTASKDLENGQQMWKEFQKISGENFEMDAYELQDILNAKYMTESKFGGFRVETCMTLVAFKDVDLSGKLGYRDFIELLLLLQKWTASFKNLDEDGIGTIDSYKLRQAINDSGYCVSNRALDALVRRYSRKDDKIHFDTFIRAMARLSTMFEVHNEMSHGRGDSTAIFNLDQFIQTTMYS